MPKNHIVSFRNGWRYQRAVPLRLRALAGQTLWTQDLKRIAYPDAVSKARILDEQYARLIQRLDGLTPDEAIKIKDAGGLKKIEAAIVSDENLAYVCGLNAQDFEDDLDAELSEGARALIARAKELPQRARFGVSAPPLNAGTKALSSIAARRMQADLQTKTKVRRATLDRLKPQGLGKITVLIDKWQEVASPRSPRTPIRVRLYVDRFVKCVGDIDPRDATAKDARDFRDWLAKQPSLSKSADKHLHALSRLFKVGVSEGLVDLNPFQGVKAYKPQGWKIADLKPRHAFTSDQCRAILKALDKLDLTQERWRDFRHIFRLMIYHGCRSGEVVDMVPSDLKTISGIPVFEANDEQPGATIKNLSSLRQVPLHPKCKDLVAYAKAAEKAGQRWVFNSFPEWKTGRAGKFQQMATIFLRETVGIKDKRVTAHSARHYWRFMASELEMPGSVSRAIQGHSLGKDDHDGTYGSVPSLKKRYEWLKKIDPLAMI